MISLVRLATMLRMSSLNCSENLKWHHRENNPGPIFHLCFLGACSVLAVARCSTIALIISSKKNQEQSVTASLTMSRERVSWRASCSCTSLPRLVVPRAARAPRSPPVWNFGLNEVFQFDTCTARLDTMPPCPIRFYSQVHCSRSQQTNVHFVLLVMTDDGISL